MDINLTTNYNSKNKRVIGEFRVAEQRVRLFLPTFWQLCDYDNIESVAKAIAGAFLVELCCYKWVEETDQLGAWFMGVVQMPCHKTNGLLCPINNLFNKVNEGMPNVEEGKRQEWNGRNKERNRKDSERKS